MRKDLRRGSSANTFIAIEWRSSRFGFFFASNICNPNTRAAYFYNVCEFFAWCERRHVRELAHVRPHHVAGYIEGMTSSLKRKNPKEGGHNSSLTANWPRFSSRTRLYFVTERSRMCKRTHTLLMQNPGKSFFEAVLPRLVERGGE